MPGGRLVDTLVHEPQPAGAYEISWNARHASSGVYLVTLKAGGSWITRKIVLLK